MTDCNCKGIHQAGACPNMPRILPVPSAEERALALRDLNAAMVSLRQRTGCGLVDAKRVFEAIEELRSKQ